MTTTIQLKPALQEFVICAFLNGSRKATAGDTFGKLIKPWLAKPPKDHNPLKAEIKDPFEFELPNYKDKDRRYNFYISPEGQYYIETILHEMFINQLHVHLDCILPRMTGGKIKDAIYDYCYSYNISFNDINFETLKKSYYRHRKKKEKISSQFVPVQSLFLC